jgi:hypothetical protein
LFKTDKITKVFIQSSNHNFKSIFKENFFCAPRKHKKVDFKLYVFERYPRINKEVEVIQIGVCKSESFRCLTIYEIIYIVRLFWENEWEIVTIIYKNNNMIQNQITTVKCMSITNMSKSNKCLLKTKNSYKIGYSIFFLRCNSVIPNKFRSMSIFDGDTYEHTHNLLLQYLFKQIYNLSTSQIQEPTIVETYNNWLELQFIANNIMDSNASIKKNPEINGIRQLRICA